MRVRRCRDTFINGVAVGVCVFDRYCEWEREVFLKGEDGMSDRGLCVCVCVRV